MAEKIVAQIEFELEQLDQLLESYQELLAKAAEAEPDLVERTALASVLHSFYNGLENIFLRIAKGLGGEVPEGDQWHRDLLVAMAAPTDARHAVLKPELTQRLAEYLSFRHFYRHSYSFFLDWDEMEKLVIPLAQVWEETKRQLADFVADLRGSLDPQS